ncbi:MAG: tetratricopeptide repeat protein [Bacteroidales bacterium]|nr:tetratricopeptide repeat protein [Bacteroidales bacterium]
MRILSQLLNHKSNSSIFKIEIFLIIFTIFYLGTTANLLSQNTTIDSLLIELPKTKENTAKVNILVEISEIFQRSHPDSAIQYAEQGIELAKSTNYNKGLANCYNIIGIVYTYLGNFTLSIQNYKKALKIYEEIGDKKGICRSYNNIGIVHQYQGNYLPAIEYLQKSLVIFSEIGDKKGMSDCYNNIGIIHYYQDNYSLALEYYQKSLDLSLEINNKGVMSKNYNNIGLIYEVLDSNTLALDYFQNSLKIKQELGDKIGIAASYTNIGCIYRNMQNYSLAIAYFQKSLKINTELKIKRDVSSTLSELALTNIALAAIVETKEEKQEKFNQAITYAKQSLYIGQEIGDIIAEQNAYEDLSNAYKGLNNYKKAFEYQEMFIVMNDSIYSIEKMKKIESLEAKFQAEKKQLQIENLENETQLKSINIKKQRIIIKLLITGSILILVFAALFYYQKLIQIRTNKELVKRNMEIVYSEKLLNENNRLLTNEPEKFLNKFSIQNSKNESQITSLQEEKLFTDFINLLEKEKYYLNQDLTLQKVSDELNSNRTYLSKAVKDCSGSSVNSIVNEYRVKEARRLLSDSKNLTLTIEYIGKKAGFKSKPTFYSAFKKITGVTPSFFLKTARNRFTLSQPN